MAGDRFGVDNWLCPWGFPPAVNRTPHPPPPERGPELREPGGIIDGLADGAVTMLGKVLDVFARLFEPAAVLDYDRSNTEKEPMP